VDRRIPGRFGPYTHLPANSIAEHALRIALLSSATVIIAAATRMAYADVINIDIEARNPLSQPGKGHKEEHAFSGKVFGFG